MRSFTRTSRSRVVSVWQSSPIIAFGGVEIGHVLGSRAPRAYLEPDHLEPTLNRREYAKLLSGYFELQARSKEDFVERFNKRYDGLLPVWVAVEILHLGDLVRLYSFAKFDDRRAIAERLGPLHADALKSWLMPLAEMTVGA